MDASVKQTEEDEEATPRFIKTASKIINAQSNILPTHKIKEFKNLCIQMILSMDY